MTVRCELPTRSATSPERVICLDVEPCALSRTNSLARPHGQPAASDEAQAQDWRRAREWVGTHGPQIEPLIARMFAFAPDLRYVIDVAPDANPPAVSVTLSCMRTQLFRFDARLTTADNVWHAQVVTRLGAGPELLAANLRFRQGSSGELGLTPEEIVTAFRRSLRFALTRDARKPA